MTFTNKNTRIYFFFTVALLVSVQGYTQKKDVVENSVFWEVSGNGLKESSYLFGTFHLMGKLYIDSLTNVMSKFNQAKTVAGELIIDSTMTSRVMELSLLKDTTLNQLLSPEDYKKIAVLFQEYTGYDMKLFNRFNPLTIQIFMLSSLQKKFYNIDPANDVAMDLYFQQRGKKSGKEVIGLETFEEQAYASMNQFSYKRQAELLVISLRESDKIADQLKELNAAYRAGNIQELIKKESFDHYTDQEEAVMLDNRNKNWMQKLPDLFKQHATFVAVGAGHLPGDNGLITLLRKAGYTVRPLKTK
ncbi:MAG TPA: TraB/GumN family protein [Ohtaekwangia sp.]|uniref:TraB/GumN family protein n=1 Tax=Ohtaekwangia sp. TaxID=2066019 RepID=UPI002F940E15